MQKIICIPTEQYYLILETYDRVINELEETKKALEEVKLLKGQAIRQNSL